MERARYNTLRVLPVAGALGADIEGVDLSKPLMPDTVSDIRQALLDHLVLFFRDQEMTPDQHRDFGQLFGPLHIHPITVPMEGHPEIIEVIKEVEETTNWGDGWHSDLAALPEPPLGSILYAKEVPPFCGDTHFLNMYLAFETLSPAVQRFVEGLRCRHWQSIRSYNGRGAMKNLDGAKESEAEHPLVRTHPETGKKLLFIPRPGRGCVLDVSPAESNGVLRMLRQHAENPDFACRFRWSKNAAAFWDNRCTQHRVTADYFHTLRGIEPARRHMHRVTIQGSRPT